MRSLDAFAQDKLDELKRRHLYRALNETVREDGIWIDRNGRQLLSFSVEWKTDRDSGHHVDPHRFSANATHPIRNNFNWSTRK